MCHLLNPAAAFCLVFHSAPSGSVTKVTHCITEQGLSSREFTPRWISALTYSLYEVVYKGCQKQLYWMPLATNILIAFLLFPLLLPESWLHIYRFDRDDSTWAVSEIQRIQFLFPVESVFRQSSSSKVNKLDQNSTSGSIQAKTKHARLSLK